MKLKIIKYIIICYFLSIILGSIFYSFAHKNYSLANALFFAASIKMQLIFSIINLFILFINKKNYYYLGSLVFFIPQLITVTFLLSLGGYSKDSTLTFYLPFFIVQTLFYFKVKKMFSDLDD
ncbi:hypothetical protein B0A58_15140 [Flavobacterium branchiophilum NBRC 15030 = ATCC 35035]|uniref:Uncharacterized protein n=1 Tax=Flavobacterium branchiophilum TaxID=55197 RepID=A0A543G2H0_9FLAO|nr:hypothetical protein [Flavobacterium branchiophilum]OXA69821.1 hypothetical protein B0A58_15140 [Flavobacterium branchiophilum NBRC 15030 = ATCC 35035]TQM40224.1 hypothetical protein BC670_1099 [Flavobacterium branchiophilum]GEM55844.1 hypothetical protein FB1_20650 [Flavobacterium branchiophilum NBRC 15030 = ATCC 35035]